MPRKISCSRTAVSQGGGAWGSGGEKKFICCYTIYPVWAGVPFANFDGTCVVERRVLATAEGGQSDTQRVVDDVSWAVGTAICLSDRKDKDRLAIKNKIFRFVAQTRAECRQYESSRLPQLISKNTYVTVPTQYDRHCFYNSQKVCAPPSRTFFSIVSQLITVN